MAANSSADVVCFPVMTSSPPTSTPTAASLALGRQKAPPPPPPPPRRSSSVHSPCKTPVQAAASSLERSHSGSFSARNVGGSGGLITTPPSNQNGGGEVSSARIYGGYSAEYANQQPQSAIPARVLHNKSNSSIGSPVVGNGTAASSSPCRLVWDITGFLYDASRKEKWFCLAGTQLFCFENPGDKAPLYVSELAGATLSSDDGSLDLKLVLNPRVAGGPPLILRCRSQEYKGRWVKALTAALPLANNSNSKDTPQQQRSVPQSPSSAPKPFGRLPSSFSASSSSFAIAPLDVNESNEPTTTETAAAAQSPIPAIGSLPLSSTPATTELLPPLDLGKKFEESLAEAGDAAGASSSGRKPDSSRPTSVVATPVANVSGGGGRPSLRRNSLISSPTAVSKLFIPAMQASPAKNPSPPFTPGFVSPQRTSTSSPPPLAPQPVSTAATPLGAHRPPPPPLHSQHLRHPPPPPPPSASSAFGAVAKPSSVSLSSSSCCDAPLLPSAPEICTSGWKKGTEIGRGTFGTVYLGLLRTGQTMAVKVIPLSVSEVPGAMDAIDKELQLLQSLCHPNVVRCYGSECVSEGFEGGRELHIFLEFMSHGSLQHVIGIFGPLDTCIARHYLRQVVCGLVYIHSKHIVHRDVKCANMLLDKDGTVKLTDFGCAKKLLGASSSFCSTVVGTPSFMAPEVLNDGAYDYKADIWSTGCALAEMVTGKPPWPVFSSLWAALYFFSNTDAEPTLNLPNGDNVGSMDPELRAFLRECFHRDVTKRPTAAELMSHPFLTSKTTVIAANSSNHYNASNSQANCCSHQQPHHQHQPPAAAPCSAEKISNTAPTPVPAGAVVENPGNSSHRGGQYPLSSATDVKQQQQQMPEQANSSSSSLGSMSSRNTPKWA